MTAKAEFRGCFHRRRKHQRSPAYHQSWEKAWGSLFPHSSEGTSPAHTLASGIQPPEPWEDAFLFQTIHCAALGSGSPGPSSALQVAAHTVEGRAERRAGLPWFPSAPDVGRSQTTPCPCHLTFIAEIITAPTHRALAPVNLVNIQEAPETVFP